VPDALECLRPGAPLHQIDPEVVALAQRYPYDYADCWWTSYYCRKARVDPEDVLFIAARTTLSPVGLAHAAALILPAARGGNSV
jgi:hypothetical protein